MGFLYIGGTHQVYHTAPVAAALAREGGFEVCAFAATDAEAETFRTLTRRLGGGAIPIERLDLPPAVARAAHRLLPPKAFKTVQVLGALARLSRLDAIVTSERTSSFLAAIPAGPQLIHIPHGAGDRAKGFEKRMRRFDHVIVAGIKDRARLIGDGIVASDRCSVSGYVKLDALRTLHAETPPLFHNDRPVILYNPHFARGLSSWEACGGALIEAFAQQDRFNLIVAPHIRLFEQASAGERERWLARAVPDRIHIDLGSESCCDMRYTLLADAYVGDVSSQVYEFVTDPRPCIFLNPHGHAWQGDPNFACWRFGPVLPDVSHLLDTIAAAHATQPDYAHVQRSGARRALGGTGQAEGATAAAAAIVARLLQAKTQAAPSMALAMAGQT